MSRALSSDTLSFCRSPKDRLTALFHEILRSILFCSRCNLCSLTNMPTLTRFGSILIVDPRTHRWRKFATSLLLELFRFLLKYLPNYWNTHLSQMVMLVRNIEKYCSIKASLHGHFWYFTIRSWCSCVFCYCKVIYGSLRKVRPLRSEISIIVSSDVIWCHSECFTSLTIFPVRTQIEPGNGDAQIYQSFDIYILHFLLSLVLSSFPRLSY